MEGRAGAGALGPRLAGRLTAELILRSPQYMSCINYYEIDLRGNKIGAIENLGATENQFDSIDLSDNAIVKLEGFPRLQRLKVLLLNNNRIAKIARNLEETIPNLDTLVLTNNRINELKDLEPLSTLTKLTHLSLLGNPVVTKPSYRLYLVSKLPKLKVLDFKKVKQKERDEAAARFGEAAAKQPAAADGAAATELDEDMQEGQQQPQQQQEAAAATAAKQAAEAGPKGAPTQTQLTAIKAAIANAQTLEEVQRLEAALKGGHMPSEFQMEGEAATAAQGDGSNGAAVAMDEG